MSKWKIVDGNITNCAEWNSKLSNLCFLCPQGCETPGPSPDRQQLWMERLFWYSIIKPVAVNIKNWKGDILL